MLFKGNIHSYIYIIGLALLAASVPTSVFMMSVSQFIILGNWLLEGDFKTKWKRLMQHKSALLFISIFFIHLIWLFPPQDYHYAFNDIRIKLPIFILPLLVVTSKPISNKELKYILYSFVASVTVVSFIILYRYIFRVQLGITDYRELSPFISHIRYSLMVVFSIFIIASQFKVKEKSKTATLLWIIVSVYLILLLFIIRANTGIIVFAIMLILSFLYYLKKVRPLFKIAGTAIILAGLISFCLYTLHIWNSFISASELLPPSSTVKTPNGNPYTFLSENKDVENGERVWFFIQEDEMRKEWNNRSTLPYDDKDKKNNDLKYTLVRYLSSKGLTKDSLGISQLSQEDISAIENSIANYTYTKQFSIYTIIYKFLWEFYSYRNYKDANGQSFIQRIVYAQTAISIIKKHFFFGVGTGNVQQAFNQEYSQQKKLLDKKYWLRAHNQYLTFLLTFGIFGFLWICFSFLYPFFKNLNGNKFVSLIFLSIALISFVNEDMLETQAGVTFIVLFYVLFAFGNRKELTESTPLPPITN